MWLDNTVLVVVAMIERETKNRKKAMVIMEKAIYEARGYILQ